MELQYRLTLLHSFMILTVAGVKKSQNDHLSCGHVHLNLYLPCCQITLGIQGNIALHYIFLLVRQTMDENICLYWLKIYFSVAPK